MAGPYIKVYKASDDSVVSEAPTLTNAVVINLHVDDATDEDEIRLYVLAEDGYQITSCVITPTGANAAKWALAPDSGGSPGVYEAYGDPLSLGTIGDTTKVYFWAKAKATVDEDPQNDTSVTHVVLGKAEPE